MRQAIIALLLALTLTLGLSGCTDKTQSGNNGSTTQNGTSDNGGSNYGTNDNNGTNYNNGTNNGSNYNGGTNNGSDNGSIGSDLKRETEDLLRGRSYDEMLRNGRVNDTDGFLTDGENHVSR